jgi:hypothetical protein
VREVVAKIAWAASVPELDHAPTYSQAQQLAGAAVVIGVIAVTIVGAIIWHRGDP